MEAMRLRGKIKFFASHKGYGFVIGEDGKDYFLHANDLAGLSVAKDDLVEFGLQDHQRGPIAVNIVRITEAIPDDDDDECPMYVDMAREPIACLGASS